MWTDGFWGLGLGQSKPRGFLATGALIVRRETPLALYKGLGAVLTGIVPKMAIRFASFEAYKGWLADKSTGKTSVGYIFLGACDFLFIPQCVCADVRGAGKAGLGAGTSGGRWWW